MRISKSISLVIILLLSLKTMAQQERFFGIRSYSGEIGISTLFKKQQSISPAITDYQESTTVSGGLLLNAQSYVWTPKFFLFDVSAGYNPVSGQNMFLVTPDRNEVRTLKRLVLRATFLEDKPISLHLFKNYNENFTKRDLLTDVKNMGDAMGASLKISNRLSPIVVDYRENNWKQEEIEKDRVSNNTHRALWVKTERSFSQTNRLTLDYHHNEYKYHGFELTKTNNTNDMVDINHSFFFDTLKTQGLRSKVNFIDQRGNQSFQRAQVFESVNLNLPSNFNLTGNYQYSRNVRPVSTLNMHTAKAQVNHQLYASLKSSVYVEYTKIKQTAFDERDFRFSGSLRYTKRILGGNTLNINYSYFRLGQKVDRKQVMPHVFDEEVTISDNEIVLIDNPFVDLNTVVVTDLTGVTRYLPNIDYLLFESGEFVEIQRIPGGLIAEGSIVLVDYVHQQNADHRFALIRHSVETEVILFNRLIRLYARASKQKYNHIESSGLVGLRPFRDLNYGAIFNYGFLTGEIEYRLFDSSIGPYRMLGYQLQASETLAKRLLFSLIASRKKFQRLDQESTEFYMDVYGGLTYKINPRSKVDVNIGYRNQQGRLLDLDLFTARLQYSVSFRLISMNVGGSIYRRDYLEEAIDYNNFYVQLMRRF